MGKTVIIGVTESVLAYRAINLANMFVDRRADVHIVMTREAARFISPLTFSAITANKCLVDSLGQDSMLEMIDKEFIRNADIMLIAPTSANTISKLSRGMSDDMLTKVALECSCTKIVAPSLGISTYKNPILQDNIDILKAYGFDVIDPGIGGLNAVAGPIEERMASEENIFAYVEKCLSNRKDLLGKRVLVTAGSTREPIDYLEFITSSSTGRTGYEIARACMLRGADVTLVTGKTAIPKPKFVAIVEVVSAKDMFMSVNNVFENQDIIINAAKVLEYAPKRSMGQNIRADDNEISMDLRRNPDIMEYLGHHRKKGQFLCGISTETRNVLSNARKILKENNMDMIIASNLKSIGTDITSETNIVTIITKESELQLSKMTKEEMANKLIDQILLEINL